MNIPKLGVGPMSTDIVKILCNYSIEMDQPLMVIASRNQVDYQDGYVCTTSELSRLVQESGAAHIMLCRDHCGPYFKDSDSTLDLVSAMERTIKTIDEDINNGFDLIHIDASRIPIDRERHASTLIQHAISRKPHIILEYGSEDNVGKSCAVDTFANDLEFLKQFKKNIRFVVAQTGSLVKDGQVGTFDTESVKKLSALAHEHGYLFKEHNSDYLSSDEVARRFASGVDAMNIAPQLGTAQTEVVCAHAIESGLEHLWESFVDEVVLGNKWTRWISRDNNSREHLAVIAGHYHQRSSTMQRIISTNHDSYIKNLSNKVYGILDTYLGRR
jgi:tagatose-1,6-bisphosphate aldolase non-catalytic subunit AgaZ/GatZ